MTNEFTYDIDDPRYEGTVSSGWITELAESDSRIHKEKVIEKALMAAKLGSADAQAFLFNCYQAYNPFYTFHVKHCPRLWDSQVATIHGPGSGACWKHYAHAAHLDMQPET